MTADQQWLEQLVQNTIDDAGGDITEVVWTTEDGREIKLGQMTDRHLYNVLNFLRGQIRSLSDQIDILWEEITNNPNHPEINSFNQKMDESRQTRDMREAALLLMTKEFDRRERKRKNSLTNGSKLDKMRARIRAKEFSHMNAVRGGY